jgi:hypothetical protein
MLYQPVQAVQYGTFMMVNSLVTLRIGLNQAQTGRAAEVVLLVVDAVHHPR